MNSTVQQRLEAVFSRIEKLGARAERVVLTKADLDSFRGEAEEKTDAYRGVPVVQGEIGGSSYVEAAGTPSGETSFAI